MSTAKGEAKDNAMNEGMSNAITHEEHASGGRYVMRIDEHEAEMTYSRASPALIIVDHTEVPETLGGQGLGTQLAEFAVKDARARGHKIVPLCPFMMAKMRKHPEWQDVLAT